ncbi:2-dehydropantoate 2-reductase [Achromobacter sp. Marseille-Q0513]|uniref:ketopantoate reductase family protein n=1 Tax=Achromobacter sp. Marseille-Q0513 TaxID=2829161 RepID=UPI001B9E9AAC|nr:2-dehydropantoate 2-reductase [Achromobacter sp. Marseille-Q0513]MBR8655132.1 2-dehydropantoate 2-reductase [Achromobacter sp. Marseille-Q0513]
MNIAILGAGAMGSLFGGLLAEAGQRVVLLDIDDAHLAAIRDAGLRLDTDAGSRHVSRLAACRPEQASEAPDLLIVFTKTLHTGQALAAVERLLAPHTLVLTLQNGLGNVEAVGRHVRQERILVGMTTWPADLCGPGHVRSHGQGLVRLMPLVIQQQQAAARVAEVLNLAALQCEVDAQAWVAIWEKVAFNAALNSLCAVTGCTVGQLNAAPEGMALARAVVAEVVATARSAGVAADAAHCMASVAHALAHHAGHKPSMLQDVLAGRRTEIAAINGAVVAQARRAGIAVPNTEMLLGLVRLVEARAVEHS